MRGLIKLITTVMLICSVYAWLSGKFGDWTATAQKPDSAVVAQNADAPVLSARQERHILYGDRNGGGHLHGQNKNCKSEFPASWNASKIIATIKKQAANDNLNWRTGNNGYQSAESNVDGVRIRIVTNGTRDHIITAYPTGPRNACFNN